MNFNHDSGAIDTLLFLDTTSAPPLGGQVGTLTILGTGAVQIPAGLTAERPATPTAAMFRYNTTGNFLEFYNGTAWNQLSVGANTVSSLTVSSASTGLSVNQNASNGAVTVSLTLDTDLDALGSLSTTGIAIRTGSGTWATRSITGTAGNITVANGDGVTASPTIDLANVGTPVTAQFVKVTTDTKGRVSATTPVAASDITTLVDGTYVNITGDTMSAGANLSFNGGEILGLPAVPSSPDAAASKAYVDSRAAGLDPKDSVRVATSNNITLSGTQTVDGITVVAGDRVLVKDQTDATQNGIYVVSAGAWTRAADASQGTLSPSAFTFVEEGTVLHDTGWVLTANGTITVGTSELPWSQFSGAGTYSAGTGLTLTGTTFALQTPVAVNNGGTGLSSLGASNQLLSVNPGGTGTEYKTVTGSTGLSVAFASGSMTLTNTGVTSLAGTSNQIAVSASTGGVTLSLPSTVSVTNLSVSSLTPNGFVYAGTGGALTSSAAATNGQILIGSTGSAPVLGSITAGTGINVATGPGSITIANTGVTSVALSLPSMFTVAGSPVTTTGTLSATLASQAKNTILAAPAGAAGVPTFRLLSYADMPFQLYAENPSTPVANVVGGANSTAEGSGASAPLYGQKAFASGPFVAAGDAQGSTYVLRNQTTTNAVTELFLDGSASRIVPNQNSLMTFTILVAARRTDATGGGAGYEFKGVLRKDSTAASTTLVGAVSKSVLGETNTSWNCDVTADTTNGALSIKVTGENAKTIRWVAVVNTAEVAN